MGTRLSAGESLVVGCLFWLPVIAACVTVAFVVVFLLLGR
jgi:hypothetical protein